MLISFFFATLLLFMMLAIIIGAPLVFTKKQTANKMVELLNIKKDEKVFDLGSGDGRLLIMVAKKGAYANGIEVNPYAVLFSLIKVFFAGQIKRVKIHWGNYWWVSLSKADAVLVYAMPGFMPKLSQKLKRELKKGTRIVSNSFQIPGLILRKQETVGKDRIYLYEI